MRVLWTHREHTMSKITSITILPGGRYTMEQVKDRPPHTAGDDDETPSRQPKEADMTRYSGDSGCVLQIQKRFGDKPPVTKSREKCEKAEDAAWGDAKARVESAKNIVSTWLDEYQQAVKANYGIPVDQIRDGDVKVKFTVNENGRIIALEFTNAKTGFSARVEDDRLLEFLWTAKATVAKK